MRKSFVAALMAMAVIALQVPAGASADEQLSLAPQVSGSPGGPGTIAITLSDSSTTGGLPAPITGAFAAYLPHGPTYDFTAFPTCSVTIIQAAIGSAPNCPAHSLLATGSAAVGASIGGTPFNETAAVSVYLVQKSPLTVEFWGNGTQPVAETLQFPGTATAAATPYAYKLSLNVPIIATVPGGPDGSVLSVSLKLAQSMKVGRKTVSLITLPKRCSGSFHWGAQASFQDGTTAMTSTATACR